MSETRATANTRELQRDDLYRLAKATVCRAVADRRNNPRESNPWRAVAEKLARCVLASLFVPRNQ